MSDSQPCGPCQGKFGPCPPMPDCEREPDDTVNRNWTCCTLCQGDKTDNIFYVNGKCKLDEVTWEQLYMVLRKVPQAKRDLQRITTDPILLKLAAETRLETDEIEDDKQAADLINKKNTLPMYTVFRGNFDGSIIGLALMLSIGRILCALHNLLSHAY